jgi:biopolymer transport protein ExbD
MRRRLRNQSPITIELFPFLSILACTIGTLILLIIVITTQVFSNNREITIIATSEDGTNRTKTPRYIECRKDGVLLHPSQTFVPEYQLTASNSSLSQLLSELRRNKDKEYLIVAVRPDGIEVFQKVRNLVEEQGIDIGYEPIDQGWKLKIETVE